MPLELVSGGAKPLAVHPLYAANRDVWRFYELSYLGGQQYLNPDIEPAWTFIRYVGEGKNQVATADPGRLNTFLFPYAREQPAEFEQRKIRSPYRNLCQPTLDLVRDLTLQERVIRSSDGAATLDDVWQDVDAQGRDVDEWMRDGFTTALLQGAAFAVADLPRYQPGEIRTLADERAAGVRPYCTWYTPRQVPDWEIDRRGAIVRLVVLEEDFRLDESGNVPPGRPPLSRHLYPDHWELRDSAGTLLEEGVNTLGRVPCEVLFSKRIPGMSDPIGNSFLSTIARLNQELYNVDSLFGELEYRQGPFLAIPGGETLTRAEVGLEAAFAVPAGAGLPGWVTLPSSPYEVLKAHAGDLVLAIRAHAGLSRGAGEQSIAARSGEALLVETQDKRAMLSGYRHELADFEGRWWPMVAALVGQRWTGAVQYSDKYMVTPFADEVAEVKSLLGLPITDAVKKELVSELVRKRLAHLPVEKLDAIMTEPAEERPTLALAPPQQNGSPEPANGRSPNAT